MPLRSRLAGFIVCISYYPVRACAARGRVIVLSVSRFVCLSAPTQDFEQNRLVYGLYLLRMSQKFKNINLYLPHERERTSGSRVACDRLAGEQLPSEMEEKHVNKVFKPPKPPRSRDHVSGHQASECYRCGGKHQASRCKFKEYECHYCKKKGHLAAVCRKKKEASKREQTNRVLNEPSDEESDEEYSLYSVSSGSTKPLVVKVQLNGTDMELELDAGASVSLISEETFHKLRKGNELLGKTKAKLFTYTGELIRVKGSANVKVDHNGQRATLPLIVTQGSGPSLFGRDWLAALKLDWQKIFKVKSNRTVQDVLARYSEVFKDELGTLKGVTAKIHTDPTATPKFHKARSVPFALRKKVEEELERRA